MHRREFLRAGILAPAAFQRSRAAAPRSYLEDQPDMLVSYLTGRLNALAAKWDGARASIRTAGQIEERNRFVREKVWEMLGGRPERTPLDAVVVRSEQRRGYRVENVMYQSRPNFWVTGNLYIPEGRGPFPAVLSPCGHYPLARMYPHYQFVYMGLARAGFVVLAYDPIGQGERRQYWSPETGPEIDDSIYEHSMPGQVLLLMGENLTQYRVWDGIRGIDYLLTRPEVDREKIGCAGHSGGGTLTLFISVADERVKCAVVNEGGTSHRWPVTVPLWGRMPISDVEQNIFPSAIHGADLCDLHEAIAPRPLLAMIENYSPRFNQAADHIRERYKQLGVPDKFGTVEAVDPHAWTVKLRLAATDWLSRWFYGRPGPEREPEFAAEDPKTLYCTPNGSIRDTHRGDTIFTLIQKKAEALPPPGATVDTIRKLIRFRRSDVPLEVRVIATTPRKGYQVEKVEFVSEPGIVIPAWVFVPEQRRDTQRVMLYASESGKERDGMELGRYERLALDGRLVISVDVRGIGETRPPHTGLTGGPQEFRHLFDVETSMTYMAWYMDESLLGMRVQDVVRSVDFALTRGSQVDLVGQGAGAVWALYAAALDSRIASVTAEHSLASYRHLARSDRYLHNAGIFVRDALRHFDLPQVAAQIAPRPLTLVAPVDAMKRPLTPEAAKENYRATEEAYGRAGAAEKFKIVRPVA